MNAAAVTLRRCFCSFTTTAATTSPPPPASPKKKPLVFLSSPQVATKVLDALLTASESDNSIFKLAAIVTQPPSQRDRGRKLMSSPVAQYALDRGFPDDLILTPERAGEVVAITTPYYIYKKELGPSCEGRILYSLPGMRPKCLRVEVFLSSLKSLQPELCITAAYGNILPRKFLKIPTKGTVNIHPSLLPLYRGAAPVQRALQDGVKETGVSLAFTIRALDAGPIIAWERFPVDDHIKAPELLDLLFGLGSQLLMRELPSILDGSAIAKAQLQDDSKATHAAKVSPDESWLSFDQEASVLHNKVKLHACLVLTRKNDNHFQVRAFAGWPGTRAKVQVIDPGNDSRSILEMKVISTRISDAQGPPRHESDDVTFSKGAIIFPCGENTELEVLEVQLPGKKVVNAAAFWNGLRGRNLKKL